MTLSHNIKRRRTLPLATAAALSLGGCGMFTRQAAAPVSPERQDAEQKVKAYQADIETALDKVDRDRLRAAAEKKPAPAPVILASSTTGDAPAGAQLPGTSAPVVPASATPLSAPPPSTPLAAAVEPAPAKVAVEPVSVAPAALPAPPSPATPPAAAPITVGSPTSGIVVAPLSGESAAVPSSIVTTFTPTGTPSLSAMTAMITASQAAAADPSGVDPVAPAEASMDDALAVLRKNVGEHPTLNTALALALLDNKTGGDAINKLAPSDQKVLTDLVAALEAMKGAPAGATLAERAAPLLDAAKHWQADADLAIPRMVLATRVDSFGVFTPVAGTFEQGQRHTVIIYCEVANFASKKGDDGWYTTKLAQQETLITDDGLLVWRPNPEEVEDRSLNQRHDFYLVKKLTIPETLAAGKYTLRMSVTDRNTNKISLVSMPIEIVMK